jgi:hypothetical protein
LPGVGHTNDRLTTDVAQVTHATATLVLGARLWLEGYLNRSAFPWVK